jgi:MFS family permease
MGRPTRPAAAHGSRALSFVLGPSLGGILTQLLTAPFALVTDAPRPTGPGTTPEVILLLFGAEFLSGFGVMVLDISIGSIFAALIPDTLRSRVTGALTAINYGTRPLGALLGGLLGSAAGLRPALWVAVVGGIAGAALLLLPSPLPRFRLPEGVLSANPRSHRRLDRPVPFAVRDQRRRAVRNRLADGGVGGASRGWSISCAM